MLKHYGLCEDCKRDSACTLRRSALLAVIECEEFAAASPGVRSTFNKSRGDTMSLDQFEQTMSRKVRPAEDSLSLENHEGIHPQAHRLAVFICANCARPGRNGNSDGRPQSSVPNFNWPFPVQQITIPCTGRLQPEHVLKAFSSGVSMVCVIACSEDNCHYLEGSKRCARRVEYVRSILSEIGLQGNRLMLYHLPGSAAEDMAIAAGKAGLAGTSKILNAQVSEIRNEVLRTLLTLPQSPIPDLSNVGGTGVFA